MPAITTLGELYASGARKVPSDAPTGFVPVRWAGYLERATDAGDVTAYRHYSRPQVEAILNSAATLRERVLWTLLYKSAARAEEALSLDIAGLDIANRRGVVVRKGGARDVIVWQTGTARLLPRLLAGRRRGPVFCTDRAARPSVALLDVDPVTGRARLSYRRAAELFATHTAAAPAGPFTLHQLRQGVEGHRLR